MTKQVRLSKQMYLKLKKIAKKSGADISNVTTLVVGLGLKSLVEGK